MATIIEIHHDDKGIIWPKEVAPYQVHLVGLDLFDEEINTKAVALYQQLTDKNIEVLFDDRPDIMAGAKFADADLLGMPIRLVISKRSLAGGGVEFKLRSEKESKIIKIDEIVSQL